MSLLMEALRKAEEAKRKSQEQESRSAGTAPAAELLASAPAAPAFVLEPREIPPAVAYEPPPATAAEFDTAKEPEDLPEAVIIEAPRDELQDYLEADPVQEDNIPLLRPGRKPGGPRQSRDQLAAASVFAAKQAPRRDAQQKHNRVMTLLGLGIVVSLGGGTALWYLQNTQSSGLAINPSLANYDLESRRLAEEQPASAEGPETAEAPAAPPDAAAQLANDITTGPEPAAPTEPATLADTTQAEATASISPPATGTELAAAAIASLQQQAATPAPPVPGALDTSEAAPVVAATPATQTPAAATEVAPPTAPRTLEISRSGSRSAVNTTLQSAWSTLQAGNIQTAALLYEEVLAEFPNNRDALIGLAAINLRNGQIATARQQYAQLLTLNPRDPYAQAGLLQATKTGNDPAHEAELKSLLQRYPDLAPLHFSLGNHYAANQRWSEAQGAYFDALLHANRDTANPVSPDYAFNLAVSLEQLQQPQAALNYYRQALELSRSSPPGYDPALLQSRLAFLEQMQP